MRLRVGLADGDLGRDRQQSIQAVIDGFEEQCPDVDVKYNAAGDNLVTVLATAVQGGNPPDLATIAQPATVGEYVDKGELQPIDFAAETVGENYSADLVEQGTFDGKLYGFFFKGANKSTVWYNVPFRGRRYRAARVVEDFLRRRRRWTSGVPAYSIGGADGWTLTDLFENIYIRTAGPEKYDQLAAHEIPWTDQSVKDALTEMGKIFSDTDNIAAAGPRALSRPTSRRR